MFPHREIRIPLRAPGVLEEGYLEDDPWSYFFFKGLCLQGIFSLRSGIPSHAHRVFGEIASPNMILPPWLTEGVCRTLYCSYTGTPVLDPFSRAVLKTAIPEDISRASNHPDEWPGYYTYRIYGIPFISWLRNRYGWDRIREFLSVHGQGILPIEIDFKAEKVFGKSWQELWSEFVQETALKSDRSGSESMIVDGYWPDPLTYWNASGIYPGRKSTRLRGRYGYIGPDGTLWISEYSGNGASGVVGYRKGTVVRPDGGHTWDPAPGGIVVTRNGSKPSIVCFSLEERPLNAKMATSRLIPGPPGAIQLSGPVMSPEGKIAVSANTGGNWDIWVYDAGWKRITSRESIELDPWWEGEALVFSSNMSGTFQIHQADMSQVTRAGLGAIMPKGNGSYLNLKSTGWSVERYEAGLALTVMPEASSAMAEPAQADLDSRPYSPWPSILPDFIAPDLYIGPSDVQAGFVTWGKDVSGDYSMRTGFRYSFSLDYLSLQAGAKIKDIGVSYARYPLSYNPENAPSTEESRNEIGLSYSPSGLGWATFSLNRLTYEPLEEAGNTDDELWADLSLSTQLNSLTPSVTLETYSGGRKSLFGTLRFVYGSEVMFALHLQGGKSWGETSPGHGTFRVGGDIGEGYFTRRPSRLFPLRGFSPNILEADKAVTSGAEVYLPLANLQMGHRTLPLFFHRLSLGTFADAGVCSERMTKDQLLIGAGFELITSMEIAWGNLSAFKLGVAWPIDQPDELDEKGPVVILQVGKPL